METLRLVFLALPGKTLETFLGGMETGSGGQLCDHIGALKPSLVEWKLNPLFFGKAPWQRP